MFQGNNVTDQDNAVVFNDLASSASLMVAGKFLDVVGSLEGNGQEQGDAEQVYTQALLKGHTTWIFTTSAIRAPIVRSLLENSLRRAIAEGWH